MIYFDLTDLVHATDNPHLDEFLKQCFESDEVLKAKGSTHNHQAWEGGYLHHITEVMNIAVRLYASLSSCRPLPFKLKSALTVLFLHDLEKSFKYELVCNTKADRRKFRDDMIREKMRIELNPEEWNALQYVEGEHDYSSSERKMGELAAFCHMCDIASARLWYDRGAEGAW
jgi:hypothetical protein